MKKLIALALAALIVCSLTVTAFAKIDSPVAPSQLTIAVKKGNIEGTAAKEVTLTTGQGNTITVTADNTYGTFNKWMIYKAKDTAQAAIGDTAAVQYVEAVAGTDYTIVSGSLTATTLTLTPATDLVITANYNGKITDPQPGEDSGSTAPKTGADVAILIAIAALALAGAGFATKKVLA